jgi:hypothetical protein
MPSNLESLKSLTLPQLRNFAKALRAKIKQQGALALSNEDAEETKKELELVKSVISDKEIEEAKLAMIKNQVLEVLKSRP